MVNYPHNLKRDLWELWKCENMAIFVCVCVHIRIDLLTPRYTQTHTHFLSFSICLPYCHAHGRWETTPHRRGRMRKDVWGRDWSGEGGSRHTERFLKSCYCVIIPPLLSSQQSYLENIFQELSVPQQLVSMANGNLISDKSGESVIMHVKLNAPR